MHLARKCREASYAGNRRRDGKSLAEQTTSRNYVTTRNGETADELHQRLRRRLRLYAWPVRRHRFSQRRRRSQRNCSIRLNRRNL
jgi:hypothetical protein